METYRRLEDLIVYQKLCRLHIEIGKLIRMLNGMEQTLEKQLPESDRRWPQASVREDGKDYDACPVGFPEP